MSIDALVGTAFLKSGRVMEKSIAPITEKNTIAVFIYFSFL